jgi:hypothetical protein
MSDPYHQYRSVFVIDVADESVVSNAITPEPHLVPT